MRQFLYCVAASGLMGLLVSTSPAGGKLTPVGKPVPPNITTPADECPADGCGKHGTSVEFLATPSDAAKKALKEEKLVFVLHISGNFENPDFT